MTKLREIAKRRGLTNAALASAVGIGVRTLRNVACGNSLSRRARQAITNTLGVEIWPDMPPAERWLTFERGYQTESATIEEAKQIAKEFRGLVKRRGKTITFIRSASFVIVYDAARGDRALSAGKIFESVRATRQQTTKSNLGVNR